MRYLLKLFLASFRVIRTEGIGGFIALFQRWLRGERGLYSPDVKPKEISYYRHRLNTEPTPDDYPAQIKDAASWPVRPRFDVVTLANGHPQLRGTLYSVLQQTYTHWNYHLVGEMVDMPADARILHSATIGQAAQRLTGEYVVIVEAGDQLAPYALYIIAKAVRMHASADCFYSDTDTLDKSGYRRNPFYKPDFSPEIMLSVNLLQHVLVVKRDLWQRLCEYTGREFALRLMETTLAIQHIPMVLYHRHAEATPPGATTDDDLQAISAYLRRSGLVNPRVERGEYRTVRVKWVIPTPHKVSIIIPSRDHADLIGKCLSTLFEKTTYPDYEVILVDTGSTEAATQAVYDRYSVESRFTLVHYTEPFNFSRACNFGASHAAGDLLLFLNNDTEILHGDWLEGMAQWFERPDVGIVGPKLLYPDGKIQHAGVVIGLHGLAGHILALADEHGWSAYGSDDWVRNFLAVTGACLMISRAVFDKVGRFEEAYQLNYSDVELCIAAVQAGYRVVYTPHVRLIHHESVTHQKQIPIADTYLFNERLQVWLQRGDPYYNPNFTYQNQNPAFQRHPGDTPYAHNRTMMAAVEKRLVQESEQQS